MIKNIFEWEVLTPNGWSDFKAVKKTTKQYYFEIIFDDNTLLKCSSNHKIKMKNSYFNYAKDLKVGEEVYTGQKIRSKEKIEEKVDLYDLLDVDLDNEYYTNNIVSHNCAHIENMNEIWTAIYPTLSTGGSVVALSCVTKDTFVYTNKGIKQINEFVKKNSENKIGGYEIPKYNILGKNKCREGFLFKNNGKVKTKKITTKFAELEGSFNHKLWACKDGKYDWHKLEELSVGDFVAIQYGKNIWGNNDQIDFEPKITQNHKNIFAPKKINSNLAYFLGMFLAEGSTYKVLNEARQLVGGNITLSCGDDLKPMLETLNLNYYYDGDFKYTISSKSLIQFLEHMGFDLSLKAKEKYIPSRVLEISKENIVSLLQGIFDGDGWSTTNKGKVGIGLASEKFIDQIRMLLNNFGILSEKRCVVTPPTKLVKISSKQYRLELNESNSNKFYDLIGFKFSRKQEKRKFINFKKRSNPKDVLPCSKKLVKTLFSYYEKGCWSLEKYHGIQLNNIVNNKKEYKTEHISRDIVLKLYNVVKDNLPVEMKEDVEKKLSKDLQWVQIKNIEEGEEYTFDFSLPSTKDFWCHSVIYNGLLGHQTPNGVGNWFHKTCEDAEAGNNEFVITKLPWDVHPDRDEEWYKKETRNMDERAIAQELNCNFNASGKTVISANDLERLKALIRDPKYKTGPDRGYWIWEEYKPEKTYLISVDVATGHGEDTTAISVVSLEDMTRVAEYKGKIDTDILEQILLPSICEEYGNPMLAIENNNIGIEVAKHMAFEGYMNLYYSKKGSHEYVSPVEALGNSSAIPGFTTSMKTRPLLIMKLEEYIRNKSLISFSSRFHSELTTFVWKNGRPEAMGNYNDDLVLSQAIGCWIRDTALFEGARDVKYNRNMLESIVVTRMGIDTRVPGQTNEKHSGRVMEEMIKQRKKETQTLPWVLIG